MLRQLDADAQEIERELRLARAEIEEFVKSEYLMRYNGIL